MDTFRHQAATSRNSDQIISVWRSGSTAAAKRAHTMRDMGSNPPGQNDPIPVEVPQPDPAPVQDPIPHQDPT
jgi:hypothetical protein